MDSRLVKPKALPKPLLLKDYLLDDMSSCSSNGFKSFQRRPCCTSTVRFLVEFDHKSKQHHKNNFNSNKNSPPLPKKTPKSALSAIRSVIAAVKHIRYATAKSPENKKLENNSILPRSLSKKILRKSSFWKRRLNHRDIGRRKPFNQLMKEDSEPLDISDSSLSTTTMKTGNSSSWSGRQFTASDECMSGNSSSDEVNLDLPHEVRNDAVELMINGDLLTSTTSSGSSKASTTTDSSTKRKHWPVSYDKEQFSPVSVLNCPFDDDEEVSSPYQPRLAHMEGTQKELMTKNKKFGCLPQLEQVSLAKQFSLQLTDSDNGSSASVNEEVISDSIEDEQKEQEDEEKQAEHMVKDLLNQMDDTLVPSYIEKLLLDFFREQSITQENSNSQSELLEEAENWIKQRKPCELFLGWDLPRNREAYIKDLEKGKGWKSLDQENKEVVLDLEVEVFSSLLNELLLDISSTTRFEWDLI